MCAAFAPVFICEMLLNLSVFGLQAVFQQRAKVWNNWQSSQATLTKKREALVKLELAGKSDKVAPMQEEVKEVC